MPEVVVPLVRVRLDQRRLAYNLNAILRFAGETEAAADEVWQRFRVNDDGDHPFWAQHTLPASWTFKATRTEKGTLLRFFSYTRESTIFLRGYGYRHIRRTRRPVGVRCEVLVTSDSVDLVEACFLGQTGASEMLAMLGMRGTLELPYKRHRRNWGALNLNLHTAVDRWQNRWRSKADLTPKPWEPEGMKCAWWRTFQTPQNITMGIQWRGESRQQGFVFADRARLKELVEGKLTATQREVVTLLGGSGSAALKDYLTPEHMGILSLLEIPNPEFRIKAASLLNDPTFKGWGSTTFIFKLKDTHDPPPPSPPRVAGALRGHAAQP